MVTAAQQTSHVEHSGNAALVFRVVGKCWEVRGRSKDGYGWASENRVTIKAHRLAYRLVHGPFPRHFVIHHTCFNKRCINPTHLEAVTRPDHNRLHSMRPTAPMNVATASAQCVWSCKQEGGVSVHRIGAHMWDLPDQLDSLLHFAGSFKGLQEDQEPVRYQRPKIARTIPEVRDIDFGCDCRLCLNVKRFLER